MGAGLWVDPSELESELPAHDDALEACQMSTHILWALSGRKFQRVRRVQETYECACRRGTAVYMPWVTPRMDAGEITNVMLADPPCGCIGVSGGRHARLRLRGRPVRRVHSVSRDGEDLPAGSYRVENSGLLTLDSGAPGDVCGLVVDYSYGSGIPPGGRRAAKILAQELLNSWTGADCSLPPRVTNVSRQGVSFTIIDKQDFLDDLRTGVYEIDLFLRAVNPDRARAKAKVFSPDLPKGYSTTANAPSVATRAQPTRTYDFELTRGAEFERGLRYYVDGLSENLTSWEWASEVRSADGDLLIDLGPHMAVDGTDPGVLHLLVPADDTGMIVDNANPATWFLDLWPAGHPEDTVRAFAGQVWIDA